MKNVVIVSVITLILGVSLGFFVGQQYADEKFRERRIAELYLNAVFMNEVAETVITHGDKEEQATFLKLIEDSLIVNFELQECSILQDLYFASEAESLLTKANEMALNYFGPNACKKAKKEQCAKTALFPPTYTVASCSTYRDIFQRSINSK